MREAKFYTQTQQDKVRCELCPHLCVVGPGERGKCGVRKNNGGRLEAENYGLVSAIHFDAIEKKPLYHFYPGRNILSFGSIGCNFGCSFCQNCDISQTTVDDYPWLNRYTVEQILNIAVSDVNNIGVAYTYNEPTIYYEFMFDIAREVRKSGMKNAMISNGFITPDPLKEILPYMDAFNIDLKSFSNSFYRKYADARLKPVKEALKLIRNADKHLEITNLIIPSLTDQEKEFKAMLAWIRDELGGETILHLSRYFPAYQMTIPSTSRDILERFYDFARDYLPYTFLGNITTEHAANTYCPECGRLCIERKGSTVTVPGLDEHGKCIDCRHEVLNYL